MGSTFRAGLRAGLLSIVMVLAASIPPAPAQQLGQDAAAQMLLDSARRACNEGKHSFAADRFRDFLRQYGGHKDAPAARYGLAIVLLEQPQKDFQAAISELQQVVGRQDFPDRPLALYYLGAA
jgi:TolA-binding protein